MAQINIGNQITGSSSVNMPPANNKAVCRYQNTTGFDLPVSEMYARWGIPNNTVKIKAIIYSDSAGNPDTLLATSSERVGVTGGWDSFSFSAPYTIPNNEYVWIGVIADSSALSSECRVAPAGTIRYNADSYADGASATFGATSSVAFEYPIMVVGDDGQQRFGRASVDPGSGNYQPDREHGERVVLTGTEDVSVTSVSTYIKTTSATVKSKAAIFSDIAGEPGVKIAQTLEVTGSTANSWLTLSFSSPVTCSPGVYWLCFIASENLVTPTIIASGRLKVDGVDTEATAFSSPSTLSTNAATGSGIDIYASYEVIGGDTPLWDSSVIRAAINDDAFEYFGSYACEGSVNNREIQRLKSLGFDNWESYLASLGYSGSVSDMKYKWLRDSGFQGSINDLLYSFYNS